ncbi:hypothetical protein B0H14DRAFT_3514902 [Mycena olivaceomarginata]|nr:hypothetical protein B0H14DRAFT_3514902 [Mycena olivaceomarginata]
MEIVALQQELALAHRNVTVRDQIIEIEEGKKAKAAGKESNKLERERKKQKREEVERAWGEMKRKHADEVESWTADCAKLVQQGVKKKDSPPKPKTSEETQAEGRACEVSMAMLSWLCGAIDSEEWHGDDGYDLADDDDLPELSPDSEDDDDNEDELEEGDHILYTMFAPVEEIRAVFHALIDDDIDSADPLLRVKLFLSVLTGSMLLPIQPTWNIRVDVEDIQNSPAFRASDIYADWTAFVGLAQERFALVDYCNSDRYISREAGWM